MGAYYLAQMRHLQTGSARSKWPTVVVLIVLVAATLFDWYWVWGVMFLYWAVLSVAVGQVFLVQTVRRDESAVLFWSVSGMWVILAVAVIVTDLFPGVATWLEATDG